MPLTAAERRIRAQIGAHAQHAAHDPVATTEAARLAFDQRFLDEVDPHRTLAEAERQRRAKHAKSAHLARQALAAARARNAQAETEAAS